MKSMDIKYLIFSDMARCEGGGYPSCASFVTSFSQGTPV